MKQGTKIVGVSFLHRGGEGEGEGEGGRGGGRKGREERREGGEEEEREREQDGLHVHKPFLVESTMSCI